MDLVRAGNGGKSKREGQGQARRKQVGWKVWTGMALAIFAHYHAVHIEIYEQTLTASRARLLAADKIHFASRAWLLAPFVHTPSKMPSHIRVLQRRARSKAISSGLPMVAPMPKSWAVCRSS